MEESLLLMDRCSDNCSNSSERAMVGLRRTVRQQSRHLIARRHHPATNRTRSRLCLYGGIMCLAVFGIVHLHISQISNVTMMADERRVAERKQLLHQLRPPVILSFMPTLSRNSYASNLQAKIIVSDSTQAAACTQSLVERQIAPESEVNVITIEFVQFDASHTILAKRLRQRYPNAVILLIGLWNAQQIHLSSVSPQQSEPTTTTMRQWQLENKFDSIHSLDFTMSMFHIGPEKWSVVVDTDSQQRHLQDAMKQTGAYLMRLPTPDAVSFQFPLTLREHFSLLTADGMQLSDTGHQVIAQNIQNFVSHTAAAAFHQQQLKRKRVTFKRNDWGSGDQCHVWYSTGDYGPYYDSAAAVQFAASSKFALQTTATATTTGTLTLQINNPFSEPRMLYLTYMSSTSDVSYAPTRILLDQTAMVMIDPFHQRDNEADHNADDDNAERIEHVVRTSPIGLVAPGIHLLQLSSHTKVPSKFGFRLVGISFLAKEMGMLQNNDDDDESLSSLPKLEFTLSRDTIHETELDLATTTSRFLTTIWPLQ